MEDRIAIESEQTNDVDILFFKFLKYSIWKNVGI